ncbi:MAG: GNAT family N-acetyltransferase [Betaproteobacteria bacterium]|nr:GNAT family N-acetyltransferase [Betaproteobacteria bacterium]
MAHPEFRLATPADAHEIAVMSRYLIEVGLRGWTWHPERVAKAIRARDTTVLAAKVKQVLIGFAIMEFGDVKGHLSLLAVKPSHQRCGIGREMIEWLEEAALAAGISTIQLELRANNFGARCFYKILGFRETAFIPGYYRNVETAVRMSRDIRRAIPKAGQFAPGRTI